MRAYAARTCNLIQPTAWCGALDENLRLCSPARGVLRLGWERAADREAAPQRARVARTDAHCDLIVFT